MTHLGGEQLAPAGVAVANPAFDVTPHELITAIVTEHGVLYPPFAAGLRAAVAGVPIHNDSIGAVALTSAGPDRSHLEYE
jgi:hypothetical protein